MNDLIARLEAAECGSWELDMHIQNFVNPRSNFTMEDVRNNDEVGMDMIKTWTTSLDVALTLVPKCPESYEITIQFSTKVDELAEVTIQDWDGNPYRGVAATVPLAICIAALHAISASTHTPAAP